MKSISAVVSIGVSLVAEALLCITFAAPAQAQFPPPPPSVGATVPATYFGPVPSDVQREYVGPYQLLKSGKIDLKAETITIPLYLGKMRDGRKVWYVLTDTTDAGNAAALGLNYAAKLNYAKVGRATRHATLERTEPLPSKVERWTSPPRGALYLERRRIIFHRKWQSPAQSAIRITLL